MLQRFPIRLKLIPLAGVPVLGALILAMLISRDAQRRAHSVAALGSIEDLARLKGNAHTFGVTSVADAAHQLETQPVGSTELPDSSQLEGLQQAWRTFAERLGRVLGTDKEPVVEVAASELEALIKAAESGVPTGELSAMLARPRSERAPVVEALFSGGFSTNEQATELSGRGVGLSALREAARGLGGTVSLQSRRGQGTTLRVRVPVS